MRSVQLLEVPALAITVDSGRPGLAHIAVPPAGAFDRASFALANRLAGNPEGATCIEFVLGPLTFRTGQALAFALTGVNAVVSVTNDGVRRHHFSYESVSCPAGALVEIGMASAGLRGYLAFRGGLEVEPELGSSSHDTLSSLGPAPLLPGDRLRLGQVTAGPPAGHALSARQSKSTLVLDVLPGPRDDLLRDGMGALTETMWTVSPDSNRIGTRLLGAPVQISRPTVPSEPMVRGGIQIPPQGQPIVLGPDHPTTGGYPVVAVVSAPSSDALAQVRPGESIRLRLL